MIKNQGYIYLVLAGQMLVKRNYPQDLQITSVEDLKTLVNQIDDKDFNGKHRRIYNTFRLLKVMEKEGYFKETGIEPYLQDMNI